MIQEIDWWAIAAPLLLVGAGLLALLGATFAPSAGQVLSTGLALLGIGAAALVTWSISEESRVAFCLGAGSAGGDGRASPASSGCSWVVDDVAIVWWFIILAATAMVV